MFLSINISSSSSLLKIHSNRVSKCRQNFDHLSLQGFDFSDGFKCSDVRIFEKLNNLSINIFQLFFYHDQNEGKPNFIPLDIIFINSDKVFDSLISKNQYVLIKELQVFSSWHDSKFVRGRCLGSCTSQNALLKHNEKSEQ